MAEKMGLAITAFALATASASLASAQTTYQSAQSAQTAQTAQTGLWSPVESEKLPRGMVKAPSNAFEIQLGTGYAQGFGPRIQPKGDLPATSVNRPGMGMALGLAYRAAPNSSVGLLGSYSMQDTAKGAELRNTTVSLDATYHASPYQRLDPYLSLGAGYRMLSDRPVGKSAQHTFSHGFQLARAAIGVDVRINKDISISPTVGGDIDMFLWRSAQGQKTQAISNPKVNAYLFAGVAGRFDLGGTRQGPPRTIIQR
ncbi:MAG TPA: autotransporter domain-containing protein [Polyangium sp.]|nr:autotransporter domain-containing protein [Polyangium sp.]